MMIMDHTNVVERATIRERATVSFIGLPSTVCAAVLSVKMATAFVTVVVTVLVFSTVVVEVFPPATGDSVM
jgi:hypothetical protein